MESQLVQDQQAGNSKGSAMTVSTTLGGQEVNNTNTLAVDDRSRIVIKEDVFVLEELNELGEWKTADYINIFSFDTHRIKEYFTFNRV